MFLEESNNLGCYQQRCYQLESSTVLKTEMQRMLLVEKKEKNSCDFFFFKQRKAYEIS